MIQLQRATKPDASLVILAQSPITKSPLLVENALLGVLGNSRLKHIPGFRLGRGIPDFEIHGSECTVLRLRIIHRDVQNIVAAGLLIERQLLSCYREPAASNCSRLISFLTLVALPGAAGRPNAYSTSIFFPRFSRGSDGAAQIW